MTITYSHDDPVSARWSGVNRPITAYEGDFNFYQHETRIATLETNYTLTISLASITQPTSSTILFTLTDATTQGPFEMPIASFRDRGDWAVATPYLVNDTFNAADGGLYRVTFDHTSDATSFDPAANDGGGHDFYAAMIPPRGNTIAAGGAVGMYYRKNSVVDYVANWSYIQASEVRFTASTGSALVSTDVAAALGELEVLIASSIAGHVVAAIDVTFRPSTGSILISTNVSDALEELATDLANYLPLAGGTMTGAIVLAADPAAALQPATKQYVDGLALNLGKRGRVRVATTANITIATALNNGDTLDGVTLATGDLVLVKNQSAPAENGVYVVGVTPVRSGEFDSYDEHPGTLLAVEEGTTNADTLWLCTSNAGGTLNTTAIAFSAASAGGGLLAANNLSDLASAATARSNLGVAIGTDVQAYDADLAALAANSSNGLWAHTGSGAGAARTLTAGNGIAVSNGDGVSGNPTVAQSANAQIDVIEFVIDGGGSTLTTGQKGFIEVPFACTITQATLLADQSGSVVVDVFKCSYAQFDAGSTHPVSGDKITASAPPTITTATKSQDATLTGWTTAISAGDILAFNVNSATTIQRVTVSLKVSHL